MTMHTNSLTIQAGNLGAPTQNLRTNATLPNDGIDFGATLARQIEQRQALAQPQRQALAQPQRQALAQPSQQPPAAMDGPKPQAAPKPATPKPAANEAKAPAREASTEPAKEPARAADANKADSAKAPAAEDHTTAADSQAGEEATSSPGAQAADAVVDMLALVASFNQVQQAAAAVAPAMVAPEGTAAQPDALLAGLQGMPGEHAEPVVKVAGDAAPGAAAQQPQDKAEPGIDLRALDLGKSAETAQLPAEPAGFAATLRDTVAQASLMQAAPVAETLTSVAAQATALQGAQATGSIPADRLTARVGTPAWDNQLGQKVIWMVGGEDQSAILELNPPDLGPVQVVLNVSNDMASVTFSSQQLEVRQALENALPRLRDMMSESGIALGNATVNAGAEGRQGQDGQGSGRPGGGRGEHGNGGDSSIADATPRQRTSILGGAGAVDTFA
ncbi:MAG: flagellar hook-length control protein FliK [Massilia sp.]|jgi:flagellar hook-length control protein FliK